PVIAECAQAAELLGWRQSYYGMMRELFFFKQKKAYEVVGSDWSSDGCSSDPRHDRRREEERVDNLPHCGRAAEQEHRSEERRVGKEGYQPCEFRGWAYH